LEVDCLDVFFPLLDGQHLKAIPQKMVCLLLSLVYLFH